MHLINSTHTLWQLEKYICHTKLRGEFDEASSDVANLEGFTLE